MEPMSAVYNIGSGRTPPEMPKDLSMGLKDILLQMFKRSEIKLAMITIFPLNNHFLLLHRIVKA